MKYEKPAVDITQSERMPGKPKTILAWKLSGVVTYVYPEVKNMFYWIDKDTKDEYVKVLYKEVRVVGFGDDCKVEEKEGEFDICVTADSNSAMIDDVMKAVNKRFG